MHFHIYLAIIDILFNVYCLLITNLQERKKIIDQEQFGGGSAGQSVTKSKGMSKIASVTSNADRFTSSAILQEKKNIEKIKNKQVIIY